MTIEDMGKAVASLSQRELGCFRERFEKFDGARFGAKIERDAKAGKLNRHADKTGRAREL
ncbi:MAG: hypothetical protein JO205_09940 [Pseudolabrys sp.]|nr:hypothetical protein [Pseudolabrys sp.]MBV9261678.1 hypothetical protein [Pseudolabrys sp.]